MDIQDETLAIDSGLKINNLEINKTFKFWLRQLSIYFRKIIGIEVKVAESRVLKKWLRVRKTHYDKTLLIRNSRISWQDLLKLDVNVLFEM